MADKKISELTELTTPDGTEELVVNDSGVSKKITQANLLSLADSVKAKFGASDDLQIYHDGSNSYISDGGNGTLYIQGTNLVLEDGTSHLNYIDCEDGGTVRLRYAGSKKLATTSTGIDVTGRITTDGITEDTSGKVGIGTSSASSRLTVKSPDNTLATNIAQFESQNGNAGLKFGYQRIEQIGATAPITFETGGSERMRILSTGGITFNGDTAAANALDDYEEGTWTPNLYGSTSGSATFSTVVAKYTKIGRLVTLGFYISNLNKNTLSGGLRISGLPYNVGNSYNQSVVTTYCNWLNLDEQTVAMSGYGEGTKFVMTKGGGQTNVYDSNINSGGGHTMMFSATYEV